MKKFSHFKVYSLFYLCLLITACSGSKIMNMASLDESQKKSLNVVFDTEHNLKADIYYAPSNTSRLENTTVVFVYGGSWKEGSRKQYQFVADALNKAYFNVVIPDYRLYPTVAYPDFIHDLETFMLWLDKNAQKYKLDTDSIILMGHSAGAYNSAMYLVDQSYKKPFDFNGFIGLAGPYDFFLPSSDKNIEPIFTKNNNEYNSEKSLPISQSPNNLNQLVKSAFIANGSDDKLVTPKNISSMKSFLTSHSINVESKIYDGKNHVQLISDINNIPFLDSELESDVIYFLKKTDNKK